MELGLASAARRTHYRAERSRNESGTRFGGEGAWCTDFASRGASQKDSRRSKDSYKAKGFHRSSPPCHEGVQSGRRIPRRASHPGDCRWERLL